MSGSSQDLQYFILTRFNLLLWNRDKGGGKVRTTKWLEHRFSLFERFCFPSVKNQTCQDFEWIVLFDSTTPEIYKERINEYQKECPQFIPVFVEPEKGRYFAEIFREEIIIHLTARRVVSTYLDNDDALNVEFVENLQQRALEAGDGTFFYYDEGYQFFTDYNYMMKVNYPRNHFVSYVERGNPTTLKSVFGFGGHYYVYTLQGALIEHIKGMPMWCEVVHEKNILNDAYFLLDAKMVEDCEKFRQEFAVNETVRYGAWIYISKFLPRYMKTFVRRAKQRIFGRK